MNRFYFLVMAVLFMCIGCVKVKHEMAIAPIHVTVEIRVKIDRELENFFGDIDKMSQSSEESKNKEGEK